LTFPAEVKFLAELLQPGIFSLVDPAGFGQLDEIGFSHMELFFTIHRRVCEMAHNEEFVKKN
jgi:hypothetical protein